MPPVAQLWLDLAPELEADVTGVVLQIGGAPLRVELARRIEDELGCLVTQWFGMAEGLLTHTQLDDPPEIRFATVGRPLSPGDEIRVIDELGRDVPPGENVGELVARGPYTVRGYYRADEHNRVAFTPDGHLRTGDIVRVRSDGNLVIDGRVKHTIIRGGEKVSIDELEGLVAQHPLVHQVAVVGLDDATVGERICAFVVPHGTGPTLIELRSFLADIGIADFKLPDRVELVGDLPTTGVGKIDKRELVRRMGTLTPAG